MVERILFGPGGASEAKQDAILGALADALTELQGKFEAGQEVALDAATLAALEAVTATVSGTVALDAPTLAALETVTATISNLPADYPDADALTALGSILAALGGTLTVDDGHPDPLTNTELRAADVNVADSGEREYPHVPVEVTAAGDTVIAGLAGTGPGGADPAYVLTPGKAIRLRWIFITPALESDPFPLIRVTVGGAPGYLFHGAMAKRQMKTGAVDAPLIVNLSVAASVAVTAILEEV